MKSISSSFSRLRRNVWAQTLASASLTCISVATAGGCSAPAGDEVPSSSGGGDSYASSTLSSGGSGPDVASGGTFAPTDPAEPAAGEALHTEVSFPGLVSQPFRWKACDYAIVSAKQIVDSGFDDGASYRSDSVSLVVQTTNRLPRENESTPEWDLVLSDGTRVQSSDDEPVHLDPEQSIPRTVEFFTDGPVDLNGARLQLHEGDLGALVPLEVPLDAPLTSRFPVPVEGLVGQVFETSDPELNRTWTTTVLSAQLDVDSDLGLGRRAGRGSVFFDVLVRVQLGGKFSEASVDDDMFAVLTNGYAVPDEGNRYSLENGEAGEFRFIFELPEETQEFVFEVGEYEDDKASATVTIPTAG